MVFSSILFVFQFLPVALILYYLTPKKFRNFVLMFVSLFFYSWGEVRYFSVMIALILVNYICAIFIERFSDTPLLKRLFLVISIIVSIGMLLFFKYLDFLTGNINAVLGVSIPSFNLTPPLGVSFYTFYILSYTIDVYRRKNEVQKNPITLMVYVVMFPRLIAGPIVRYTDIQAELKSRSLSLETIEDGIEDFVIGLARKVLIANNVGMLWSEVERIGVGTISTGLAWLGILAFALQIYFDFSGYSQMSIGIGKMIGFKFPQNFDHPYSSRSVTEFWRRWHMTLGIWFREYVYFPLGGSRRGNARTILNLLIVWTLTGLWHGASWNFVIWGLYFALLLIIEKTGFISFLNKHKILSHLYMILVILVGWVLFAVTDLTLLLEFLKRMFVPTTGGSFTVDGGYFLRNYVVLLMVGCFFSTSFSGKLYANIRKNKTVKVVLMLCLFVISIAYLVDSAFNPFLYFRF